MAQLAQHFDCVWEVVGSIPGIVEKGCKLLKSLHVTCLASTHAAHFHPEKDIMKNLMIIQCLVLFLVMNDSTE